MSYIDDNLISGERVLFRTHLHWKVFILPVFLCLAGIALMAVAMDQGPTLTCPYSY